MKAAGARAARILFAVSNLGAGGSERSVAELANALSARGRIVAVLTLNAAVSDHFKVDPRIQRIALDLMWDSASLLGTVLSVARRSAAIRRAVSAFRPDVVISFIDETNVRVLAALLGSRYPVIVCERTDPRRHGLSANWQRARGVLYKTARAVVVQTRSVAEWAANVVPRGRVHVIPNFVRDLPSPQSMYPIAPASTVLGVGRLSAEKGFDLLIRAFAAAQDLGRDATLCVLGEGSERQRLEQLGNDLGLADRLSFPGTVANPEHWMSSALTFVLPSRYEGFPNALLEAMAMKCPVIAFDCDSGPRDMVEHGVNGLLVPPEDVGALAAAMNRMISDPALRRVLSSEAVRVRERFAKEATVERWELLLSEVTGK